jgi:phosphatidate cytidylyltransferase
MNLNNTQQRIASALIMIGFMALVFYLGSNTSILVFSLMGLLVSHELFTNFLKLEFLRKKYNLYQGINIFIYLFVHLSYNQDLENIIFSLSLMLTFYQLFLLFNSTKKSFKYFLSTYPWTSFILITLPVLSLQSIFYRDHWLLIIIGLFLLNFSVDTAAWFFGKNFGKRKLWEAISPKKTIEGFIGGVLTATLVFTLYWSSFIGQISISFILAILFIACCSQLGDLVQSKIKRQFGVKDSSNLIPGHGGVYDRIDSLIFVSPLFAIVIKLFIS